MTVIQTSLHCAHKQLLPPTTYHPLTGGSGKSVCSVPTVNFWPEVLEVGDKDC